MGAELGSITSDDEKIVSSNLKKTQNPQQAADGGTEMFFLVIGLLKV